MIAVSVKELTKMYSKKILAVDHVSFDAEKGTIVGVLGPNGAGKTTTVRMLTTLTKPTSGTAVVEGYDIVKQQDQVRKVIGIVPQNLSVDDDLTGRENLTLQANLYNIGKREAKPRVDGLLELMKLSDAADRDVETYSGGMRKRLEIACGLVSDPKVLFLDEPTLGLDLQSRLVVWDHLRMLNQEKHLTIFLTTHYMEEADSLCDTVLIMNRGRIVAAGTPESLKLKVGEGFFRLKLRVEDQSAFQKLRSSVSVISVERVDQSNYEVKLSCSDSALQDAIRKLEAMRVVIIAVEPEEPTLSDVFLHYTGAQFEQEPPEAETVERVLKEKRLGRE